jgi:hypothetical protein
MSASLQHSSPNKTNISNQSNQNHNSIHSQLHTNSIFDRYKHGLDNRNIHQVLTNTVI